MRTVHFCQALTKTGRFRQILAQLPSIKYHEKKNTRYFSNHYFQIGQRGIIQLMTTTFHCEHAKDIQRLALIIKLGNIFLNYKLLYWNSVYNTILIENNNSILTESKVQYYAVILHNGN
jgi:hypothetical protein